MTTTTAELDRREADLKTRQRRLGALALPPGKLAQAARTHLARAGSEGRTLSFTQAVDEVLADSVYDFAAVTVDALPATVLARRIGERIAEAQREGRALTRAQAATELREDAGRVSSPRIVARRARAAVSAAERSGVALSFVDAIDEQRAGAVSFNQAPAAAQARALAKRARQLIAEAGGRGEYLSATDAVNLAYREGANFAEDEGSTPEFVSIFDDAQQQRVEQLAKVLAGGRIDFHYNIGQIDDRWHLNVPTDDADALRGQIATAMKQLP